MGIGWVPVRIALTRVCRATLAAAAFGGLVAAFAPPMARAADPIQGGFRLFDPDSPSEREAGVLSLGPLVAAGARVRTSPAEGVPGICKQMVLVMLGSEGTKRRPSSLRLKQRDNLVAFFVLSECVGDEESCISGTSQAVAVSGCSGSVKLRAHGGISGRVKVKCKDGIDTSDAAFGLTAAEQALLADGIPDLGRKFSIAFKERAGERLSQEDLDFKIQNLDVDALDDVVGTYLADDALPLCEEE